MKYALLLLLYNKHLYLRQLLVKSHFLTTQYLLTSKLITMRKFFSFLSLCLIMTAAVHAEAFSTCNGRIGNNANQYAYITWATEGQDVVIYINGPKGDMSTAFRGDGMQRNGFFYKSSSMAEAEQMTNYFNATMDAGKTYIRWTPKSGVTPAAGDEITFNPETNRNLEWKTATDGNAWNATSQFTYSFGASCTQIAKPTITAVSSDGTITFPAVENAEAYKVYIYRGETLIYTEVVETSGAVLGYQAYTAATLSVRLQALTWTEGMSASELSDAVSFNPVTTELPGSNYCAVRFGNDDNNYANITFITNSEGQIVITISDYETNYDATFRGGNGMNPDAFKINGNPLKDYFDRQYAGDKTTTITYTPKEGADVRYGDVITYNGYGEAGQIEWYIGNVGRNYNTVTFTYIYGTACAQLPAPVITSISADSVITFSPVEGATQYVAQISYEGEQQAEQIVQSGDVLHFTPLVSGTYTVVLIAKSDNALDSDPSAAYNWQLNAQEITLGESEYCGYAIGSGNTEAYISWLTDAEGNVVITISGDDVASWRGGNGLDNNNLDKFFVGEAAANTYFERQYVGDGTQFILKLREGKSIVPGTKISYKNGTVEWRTADNNNCWGTYSFQYTYGTTCPTLAAPAITSISQDGTVTFSAVEGASEYVLTLYRGEMLVHSQVIASGEQITYKAYQDVDVVAYLEAHSDAYLPAKSEGYAYHVAATTEDLPLSEVCQKLVQDADGGIYLTAETDEQGNIILTISGTNDVVWRGGGLQMDMFTVYGQKLQNYFEKKDYAEGTTIMTLAPKADMAGMLRRGDVITYKGNVEWKVTIDEEVKSPWIADYEFTYIYGTVCTVSLPRLETPVIEEVTAAGVIRFETVSNAATYLVSVLDADEEEVLTQTITDGAAIERTDAVVDGFVYYVRLKAQPAEGSTEYRESLWSELYTWDLTGGVESGLRSLRSDALYEVYTIDGMRIGSGISLEQIPALLQSSQMIILRDNLGTTYKMLLK